MSVTDGRPSVSVPVLSTTRVSTFSIRSSASAFLISTPWVAPRPTPTMMEIGVARPRAHGQAMIRTATATMRPCAIRGSGPTRAQTTNATTAMAMTAGTNTPATRSAIRWIGARERWASATMATMRASIVSRPTFSAVTTRAPVWFRVPPMTVSPGVLVTGMDSPVTSDSSTEDRPSGTVPSTGTFSPGRTRSRSPSWTSSRATSSSVPSAAIRRAVLGARFSSALMAPEVCSRARSSSTWPSRTSTVMTAAASKYTSTEPAPARDHAVAHPGGVVCGTRRGRCPAPGWR